MKSSRRSNSNNGNSNNGSATTITTTNKQQQHGLVDDNDKDSKAWRQTKERFCRRVCTVLASIGLIGMVLVLLLLVGEDNSAALRTAEHKIRQRQHRKLELQEKTLDYEKLVEEVRAIKKTGVVMEIDPESLVVTGRLQHAARELCKLKYYDNKDDTQPAYRIAVTISYQNEDYSSPNDDKEQMDTFVIEMAPLALQPYSVYNFLEVARGLHHTDTNTQNGSGSGSGFHRKAGHVLQATMSSAYGQKPLAFQEYSKDYPHQKRTVGYCGRPSGGRGCWYISTLDNTKNHGPGSQQKRNPYEADANFGTVIDGYDLVVPKIRQSMPKDGFLTYQADWVLITDMKILVPTTTAAANNNSNHDEQNHGGDTVYVEWQG